MIARDEEEDSIEALQLTTAYVMISSIGFKPIQSNLRTTMKNIKELRKLNDYLESLNKSMFEMNVKELKNLNKNLNDSLKLIK